MSCSVPFAFRLTSQPYMLIVKIRSLERSNGEHGSSGSGPGPKLFLHRDCPRSPAAYPLEFLGQSS